MKYAYHAYGLCIESATPLQTLSRYHPQLGDLPNISLVEGPIETQSTSATTEVPVVFKASTGKLYAEVLGAGRYEVTARNIRIERAAKCDEPLLNTFLYGVILATSTYFNNRLPLHASTIEYNGSAIAFCGDSGSGKSTTAAIFANAGHKMITDDVLALAQAAEGDFRCFPGPPFSKLTDVSMKITQQEKENVEYSIGKYHIHSKNWISESFHSPSSIFIIEIDQEIDGFTITPLSGIEKVQAILRYLYRNYWIDSFGLADEINRQVMALSPQVSVFRLQMPKEKVIAPNLLMNQIT